MATYLESVYEDSPAILVRPAAERKTGASSSCFQLFMVILLGFASYLTIKEYVVTSVEVVGSSMAPTLRNQDYYLLNRWIYHFREPQRFEVVVLRDPTDEDFSVKRIVAKAGETVSFRDGCVYVNGKKLYEPYLPRDTETFPAKRAEQTIRCGEGEFIVLGDNRENSLDSRYYGTVPKQNILGMLVY